MYSSEQEVLTMLRIGMETQMYIIKGSVKAILKMLQLFKRMKKQKIISGKAYDNFERFLKDTKGDFQIMNIPTQDERELTKMCQDFNMLGVTYNRLPDLDASDGYTQIAYYAPHVDKVETWMQAYCMKHLQGGEKQMERLRGLTQGQTSLVSIPYTGEKKLLQEDFNKLGINYAILPDLNVGDGYIQVLYANEDASKVRTWFELYQKQMLENGVEIEDLKLIQMDEYTKTGKMNTDGYEKTASEEMKEIVGSRDKNRERSDFEKTLDRKENQVKTIADQQYLEKKSNPGLREITINQELVVEPEKGSGDFFISRIPGTYENSKTGQEAYYLFLNKKDVFVTDNGKTYVAFLEPDKTYYANIIREGKFHIGRKYSMQELEGHYAKVMRDMKEQRVEAVLPGREKIPQMAMKSVLSPK